MPMAMPWHGGWVGVCADCVAGFFHSSVTAPNLGRDAGLGHHAPVSQHSQCAVQRAVPTGSARLQAGVHPAILQQQRQQLHRMRALLQPGEWQQYWHRVRSTLSSPHHPPVLQFLLMRVNSTTLNARLQPVVPPAPARICSTSQISSSNIGTECTHIIYAIGVQHSRHCSIYVGQTAGTIQEGLKEHYTAACAAFTALLAGDQHALPDSSPHHAVVSALYHQLLTVPPKRVYIVPLERVPGTWGTKHAQNREQAESFKRAAGCQEHAWMLRLRMLRSHSSTGLNQAP